MKKLVLQLLVVSTFLGAQIEAASSSVMEGTSMLMAVNIVNNSPVNLYIGSPTSNLISLPANSSITVGAKPTYIYSANNFNGQVT